MRSLSKDNALKDFEFEVTEERYATYRNRIRIKAGNYEEARQIIRNMDKNELRDEEGWRKDRGPVFPSGPMNVIYERRLIERI